MMSTTQRVFLMTALTLYAVLVFILDVITPQEIDIWVLNLPVIVVPVFFRNVRMVAFLSLACSAVVVLGSGFSPPGSNPPVWDILNRAMGIATLWLIAVMAFKIIQRSTQLDNALRALEQSKELEREALQREVLAIAGREQRQIGQELHDGVGQDLTGLGLMAQSLAQRLPEPAAEKRIALRLIAGLDSVHQQVRELSRGLIPVHVESRGLSAALDDLAARTTEASGISVTAECPEWVEPPDHATATQLFRIAQEAVSNAVRHGRPRHIRLTLLNEPNGLRLRIRDDGIGIQGGPRQSNGLGLRIMQYRAGQIGGALQIGPSPGGGTVVSCTLPRSNGNDGKRNETCFGQGEGLDRG
jgi:signal transduction histidine kinase